MIPWQAVITGAVGVGGTGLGAWLTGRRQTKNLQLTINADNQRARRAEKRRVYAEFMSALTMAPARTLRDHGSGLSQAESRPLVEQKDKAVVHLVNACNELALLAPPALSKLADDSAAEVDKYATGIEEGGEPDLEFYNIRLKPYDAMRADLGEPLIVVCD